MLRILQLESETERSIAIVDEPRLCLLDRVGSIYDLALSAIAAQTSIEHVVEDSASDEWLEYDQIYQGSSLWQILSPIDHPHEPARCLVSGTGLTHLGSAEERDTMHRTAEEVPSDSMKMFRSGLEGGRPTGDSIGTAPEWFYKGCGTILKAHLEPLLVPSYALDGGEEAEVAGVYIIASDGTPYRIGLAAGNEFSDHKFERTNYLNLAGSKIRTCSLGPEIVINAPFDSVDGQVTIWRGDSPLWSQDLLTGEAGMCHSVRNIEYHHFKHFTHRRPGDLHVHFFGAHSLSFGGGIELQDGDIMEIQFDGFGRPLRNPIRLEDQDESPIDVIPL